MIIELLIAFLIGVTITVIGIVIYDVIKYLFTGSY